MSFTPSSGQISASQIRAAFNISGALSLRGMRSTVFWRSNAFRGTLPADTIRMADFYGMSGTSPVVPSFTYYFAGTGDSAGVTKTDTYTVPLYYSMQIFIRGGGGGGAGGGGATFNFQGQVTSLANGSAGGNGSNSSFGSIVTATGGTGGASAGNNQKAANGQGPEADPPNRAYGGVGGNTGWAGIPNGGDGGDGGYYAVTVYSPVNGGTGPAPGSTIQATSGAGGAGGGGYGNGSPGRPGRWGAMVISTN